MLTVRERLRKRVKGLQNSLSRISSEAVPVFVFGEMRSGTNMLLECLSRARGTEIFNENDEDAFEAYMLRDLSVVSQLITASSGSHVIFKALADSARASEILLALPASKAIWLYRRYKDVVNSALRKWKEHGEYLRLVLHEPEKARWRRLNLSEWQLEIIRKYYSQGISDPSARALIWYIRNSLFFENSLENCGRAILVKYENIVARPELELGRVSSFLGIPFRARVFRHVNTASVNRHPVPEVNGEIAKLCDSLTERLDAAWRCRSELTESPDQTQ